MTQFFAQIRQYTRLLPALLAALLLSGCVAPQALTVKAPDTQGTPTAAHPAPAPQATAAQEKEGQAEAGQEAMQGINPHLAAALSYAPATTHYFGYTDWTILKRVAGVEKLTSAAPFDERFEFMRHLAVEQQALGSSFGASYFIKHAETWGWDSTDLLWEANLAGEGAPVFALRFRDDFDFAPVLARFEERGYTLSEHDGTPLYHHDLDLSVDWMPSTEFAIFNIAYFEPEKLFLMSSQEDELTATLDAIAKGVTLTSLPGVRSVAAALGDAGAAYLSTLGCQELDVALIAGDSPAATNAIIRLLIDAKIKGLYSVLGVGYRVERRAGKDLPLGIIVHHYPIAAQAQADLRPRRRVAESGNSLANGAPYSELFEVIDASVAKENDGSANLILSLHALDRSPQLFFNMLYHRDMLFSMCGGG